MENQCFFKWKFNCEDDRELSKASVARIQSIIEFSKEYKDNIHVTLEEESKKNQEFTLKYHRSCVSSYTSKHHLNRHKKRESSSNIVSSKPPKRLRRSEVTAFSFRDNCLFCGERCEIERDKKHPNRWRRAVLCRTADAIPGQKSFKQRILDVCERRNDNIANQVRLRVEGAVSDLHAADARYHVDCLASFTCPNSIKAARNAADRKTTVEADNAFNSLIEEMSKDRSRYWNSVQLFHQYELFGGRFLSRRSLLSKIKSHFLDDIAILSSNGLSSVVVFKKDASTVLNLVSDTDDDLEDMSIECLSKVIVNEVKQIKYDQSRYDIRITKDDMSKNVSKTLMDLLAALCDGLKDSLPALLIGNIVTSILSNKPTSLQISLGNLLRDQKSIINKLYPFKITCSYDEILRFKKSAALAATKDLKLSGIDQGNPGLIQSLVDNFDADISSQNGKVSTHSLAVLMTQPMQSSNDHTTCESESIVRISKADMNKPIEYNIPVSRYQGPKTVPMPDRFAKKSVLPLKVLCSSVISERRAKELDVAFMIDVINTDSCPEFNGYNTMITRDEGVLLKPKTQAVYLPLIDMTPSDPDTIMTALHETKRLTKERDQKNTIFTSDQQLYKVAVDVKWAYPDEFSDVILRLGGMHMLMSFVSAVGTLMKGTGLSEVLESTFAGVTKMLSGKKFPQNVRAMRLVVEEILRSTIQNNNIGSMEDLLARLERSAGASKTSKLWVDCFIKPVFIMMMYVRAEREGDWPLHLVAVKQMLPYFFASAHVNYARYGLYYLRSMESLGNEEVIKFMKGEHTMHHVPGIWNGIWSDMFIETTFMRYGHGPSGIIGITLKPETLKTWALGLHICSRLEQDIADIAENGHRVTSQVTHKEEMAARIASDGADRETIKKKLELCIDPLDAASHSPNVVNIVSGKVADSSVNAQEAVAIGKTMMKEFESKWPEGFRNTISKRVITVSDGKKHIKVGSQKVYDTTVIYSRVIGLQASSREIDLKNILGYELAPVPTSMFLDSGEMRICKSKSDLKNKMAISSSARLSASNVAAMVLDGSAVLWVVHWPAKGIVSDFVDNFKKYLATKLVEADVYLIFDRYEEYSTKSVTRDARKCEASRVYQLSPNTPLPSQKAVLTVSENKKQLMEIICISLVEDTAFHNQHTTTHKLVITGNDIPKEVHLGVVIERRDIATSHEEADNIIAQQALMCAKQHRSTTIVIADDTDVFVLLLYHYHNEHLTSPMLMTSPIQQRTLIDIQATVEEYQAIIPGLLGAHAISGCDTVATYFGIGKGTVLKNLIATPDALNKLGCLDLPLSDVIDQATKFIGACYNFKDINNGMSEIRYKVWTARYGRSITTAPKIQSLPPSTAAFTENVKRAHLQTSIWKVAVCSDPPQADPLNYGYIRHEPSKSLLPTTVPDGEPLAPDPILALIRCNCSEGESRCKTSRCSCTRASLPCTPFCKCNGGDDCLNELTRTVTAPQEVND